MHDREHIRYYGTAAACGLIMVASFYFSLTVFNIYIGIVSGDLGIARGVFSVFNMIRYLLGAVMAWNMGKLMKRFSLRNLLLTGILLISVMYVILSLTSSLAVIYLAAVLGGMSIALTSVAPVSILLRNWFVKGYGTVLSIVISSSGVAGLIFNPILSVYVHDNGWRAGYRLIALLVGGIFVIGFFLLHDTPQELHMQPMGAEQQEEKKQASDKAKAEEAGAFKTTKRAPGNKLPDASERQKNKSNLCSLLLINALCSLGASSLYSNLSAVLIDLKYPQVFATGIVVSIASVMNIVGKVAVGRMVDKYGMRIVRIWYLICIIDSAFFAVFRIQNTVLAFIGAVLVGFCGGIYSVPTPLMAVRLFKDSRDYSKVISYSTAAQNLCSAFVGVIFHGLFDFTGSYLVSLLYMTVMSILCYLTVFLLYMRNRQELR